MKARFFALAALVLGLASCQQEFDGAATQVGGEVDFQLAVSAPELSATRGADKDGRNGHDSAYGAIDYLSDAEWENVDLRYTLEVYDADALDKAPVKDRMVKVVDKYEPVYFDLRLVPNREYQFVVFADFVVEDATDLPTVEAQAELGKHHIIGATLQDIKLKEDKINTELTDAYFASESMEITKTTVKDIELKRPYGKVRVVATDLHELNLNVQAASIKVVYTAPNANAFDAVTGTISGDGATEFVSTYNVCDQYTAGYDAKKATALNGTTRQSHKTLSTDYILANEGQEPVHFEIFVYDQNGIEIKNTKFNTDIPVQRNYLTTIVGNVLTTATEINVTIDDDFYNNEEDDVVEHLIFESFINSDNDAVVTLDKDYVVASPIYVKNGVNAVLNLNGYSIKNNVENVDTDVIIVEEGSTLTIVDNEANEGLIEAVSGNEGYAVIAEGTVIINGGRFKAGRDADGEPNAVVYARGNGKVYVNGGEFFNDELSKYVLNKKDANRATTEIVVKGGKFWHFDPSQNTAEGEGTDFVPVGWGAYPCEFNYGVKAYEVKPVSEANFTLNNEYNDGHFDYENIVIVNSVFHNGGKLTIDEFKGSDNQTNAEVELEKALVAGKGDVVVSGEGEIFVKKNSTIYEEGVVSAAICAKNGATVTFENYSGYVDGLYEDYAIEVRGGNIVVNSGNFRGAVSAAYAVEGNIEINAGAFEANDTQYGSTYLLNLKGGNAGTIVVKGGQFKNFDPMNNKAENPAVNFMAEGFVTYADGEWFKVMTGAVVTTADEFKAAAANADLAMIIVGADLDFGTEYVSVGTSKVIMGNGYNFIAGGKTTKNYALGISGDLNVTINNLVMKGGGGIYVSGGANVEVNDVTLKIKYSASGRHMFYVNNATLTVNSGDFAVLNTGYHYFSMQNNAVAYVKGGTFENMLDSRNPVYTDTGAELKISGGKFRVDSRPFDPDAYIVNGYSSVREGAYKVVYKS